jgi:hypothetical protein
MQKLKKQLKQCMTAGGEESLRSYYQRIYFHWKILNQKKFVVVVVVAAIYYCLRSSQKEMSNHVT